jgi:hypothetical protein
MNFIKHLTPLLLFSLLLLLGGCVDDSQDMDAPVIELMNANPPLSSIEICGELDDRVFFLKDSRELQLDLRVTDDNEIAELKWDIHNNFDCHGHGGGSAPGFTPPAVEQQTEDWSLLQVDEINAASYDMQEVLQVPENVTAGNYHFGLQAVDQSGNTSPFADVFTIRVYNSSDTVAPELQINEPASRSLEANRAETISFSGELLDNQELGDGGNAIVFLTYRKVNSTNAFTGPYAVVPAGLGSSFSFELEFEIPNTLTAGEYIVNLQGHDGVRNVAPFEVFSLSVVN